MKYGGLSLADAAKKVIFDHIAPMGGDGGFIAVDSEGRITMPFNTEGMYRACVHPNGEVEIEIYKGPVL